MKKMYITWRRATKDELKNGASEMIKVSEEEIEVPDIVEEKTDLIAILKKASKEEIDFIKQLLK